jgi:hypothetical protein
MPTIKNFGFMWERDKVDWGSRGRGRGSSLIGRRVNNLERVVDFAEQTGIYVLYDRFEQPVQIGQSERFFRRLKDHRRDHLRNRWSYFSWFGFYKVGRRNELLLRDQATELRRLTTLGESLNELEAILIQVLEPRLNRRGPNWNEAEEYLQVPAVREENEGANDEE